MNKRITIATFALCAFMPARLPAAETVQLKTSDGKAIQGLLYGRSDVALVLCHGRGYRAGGISFREQCEYLENKGIMCLALSFRGYPAESPPAPRGGQHDIVAAIAHLASLGAKRIFVLGSSMGGFIALRALPELEASPGFSGLIVLSAFHSDTARESRARKLFIAAEDDTAYYRQTLACFEAAATPKQMIAFKTGGHGQMLFRKHGQDLLDQIVAFVRLGQ